MRGYDHVLAVMETRANFLPGYIKYVTILGKRAPSAFELLGHQPLGRVFFDDDNQSAHGRYEISVQKGAVAVVRPDGWVGTMATLGVSTVPELEGYFGQIFTSSAQQG